jgi:hypothetical protein
MPVRVRQPERVDEAPERDGRGEEATVEDRERPGSAYGRGEELSGEREAGVSPQRSESEKRLETGREPDGAVGAVVQHATIPGESETRDEAMGAVAQRATVPRECESYIEQRLWASASWPEPVFGVVGAGDLAWLEGWQPEVQCRSGPGPLRRVSTCGIVTRRVPLRVGHGS